MNSLWISLQFFALILAELTVLFLAISLERPMKRRRIAK